MVTLHGQVGQLVVCSQHILLLFTGVTKPKPGQHPYVWTRLITRTVCCCWGSQRWVYTIPTFHLLSLVSFFKSLNLSSHSCSERSASPLPATLSQHSRPLATTNQPLFHMNSNTLSIAVSTNTPRHSPLVSPLLIWSLY